VSNGSGRGIDAGSRHERYDGHDAECAKYRGSAQVGPVPPAQRFATAGTVLFRDLFDARSVNGVEGRSGRDRSCDTGTSWGEIVTRRQWRCSHCRAHGVYLPYELHCADLASPSLMVIPPRQLPLTVHI